MKLYEKTENGLNVYDYSLNPEKMQTFKQSMLALIPDNQRIYIARTNGKLLLTGSEISIPYFSLNDTFQSSGLSYYHSFNLQENLEEADSLLAAYCQSTCPMLGTIHTFSGPEEFYLKTGEYEHHGSIYEMSGIIKVPEPLFNLESLLGEDDDDDMDLAIMFENLFDLSYPTFYGDSFMQSMYQSGFSTKEDVLRKIEASGDILYLKRRHK